jgi:hypothetical protein
MLVAKDLATQMYSVYGSKDSEGASVTSTDGAQAFADGFIKMITSGQMRSTITGVGNPNQVPFPPQPWSFLGASPSGNFVGLNATLLYSSLKAAIPKGKSDLMLKECQSLAKYFMTQVNISFARAVGHCSATTGSPPTPGPLLVGQATGGKATGATGEGLATQISQDMGVPKTQGMVDMYQALCDYFMKNVELSYPPNTINGLFVLPGPTPIPIQNGIGSGGMIR